MQRSILAIAGVAALNICINSLDAAAAGRAGVHRSGQGHLGRNWQEASAWGVGPQWRQAKGWRTPVWTGGFYISPLYYADPYFFSQCYRRTRVETLYGVHWQTVRICN